MHDFHDVPQHEVPELFQRRVSLIKPCKIASTGAEPSKKSGDFLPLLQIACVCVAEFATIKEDEWLASSLIGLVCLGELIIGDGLIFLIRPWVSERRAHTRPQEANQHVALIRLKHVVINDDLCRLAHKGRNKFLVCQRKK